VATLRVRRSATRSSPGSGPLVCSLSKKPRHSSAARSTSSHSRRPGALEHCEILLSLGTRNVAGDVEAARASCARPPTSRARRARRSRSPRGSPLRRRPRWHGVRRPRRPAAIALLEEAIDWLGAADSVLRVHCLARLAAELYYNGLRRTATRALRASRRDGFAARRRFARMTALHSRHWSLWGPDSNAEEQRRAASELLRLADQLGDKEMLFRGTSSA